MLLSILQKLIEIDTDLLLKINSWNSPFFDVIMSLVTNKYFWIPLYVVLIIYMWRFNRKTFFIMLIFALITVILTDQVSVQLFKNVFKRLRPCYNEEIRHLLHMVNNKCGGKYSFVSSHACNTAGIATFFILLFRKKFRWFIPILISYTLLNSYSRVYLGVHYPGDVIFGTIVGIIIGVLTYKLLIKFLKLRLNAQKEIRSSI